MRISLVCSSITLLSVVGCGSAAVSPPVDAATDASVDAADAALVDAAVGRYAGYETALREVGHHVSALEHHAIVRALSHGIHGAQCA